MSLIQLVNKIYCEWRISHLSPTWMYSAFVSPGLFQCNNRVFQWKALHHWLCGDWCCRSNGKNPYRHSFLKLYYVEHVMNMLCKKYGSYHMSSSTLHATLGPSYCLLMYVGVLHQLSVLSSDHRYGLQYGPVLCNSKQQGGHIEPHTDSQGLCNQVVWTWRGRGRDIKAGPKDRTG